MGKLISVTVEETTVTSHAFLAERTDFYCPGCGNRSVWRFTAEDWERGHSFTACYTCLARWDILEYSGLLAVHQSAVKKLLSELNTENEKENTHDPQDL